MIDSLSADAGDQHVGIFGPGRSGKTTLAKQLVKQGWERHKIRSLVLDLNNESWGEGAVVFNNEDDFWPIVWKSKKCFVVVEEATETIARDNKKSKLFTRIRHRGHKLIVIGHTGTNLLPIQREQLHTLYLFRQTPKSAVLWQELFGNDLLLESAKLKRYEFLQFILWGNKNGKDFIKKRILSF